MKQGNFNKISVFTATTTTTLLFPRNLHRVAYIIYNNGAAAAELLDSSHAAYGQGFPLSNGSSIDDKDRNPQAELYVVASAGTVELRVWEIIGEGES